jgi:8-oxo-dGTP diphosphatase
LLLFLRDNKQSIPFPNTWDLIGGHMEDWETVEEALLREIREEINLTPQSFWYIFFKEYFCPKERDVYENIKYIFVWRVSKTLDELELFEGQKLEYFDYDEITTLPCANMIKDILLEYIQSKKHEKN